MGEIISGYVGSATIQSSEDSNSIGNTDAKSPKLVEISESFVICDADSFYCETGESSEEVHAKFFAPDSECVLELQDLIDLPRECALPTTMSDSANFYLNPPICE